MAILSPSILSADYMNMERDLKETAAMGVKWLHVDIMDGLFVPNLSFGYSMVAAMRKVTDYLHSRGKTCELHSCGKNLKQVPNMIAAGWDAWFPQNIVDSREVYELYGDKILVGVDPKIDIEGKTDDEIRAAAREFVDKYMQPGKPCFFAFSAATSNPVFGEELYAYSRKKACGEA